MDTNKQGYKTLTELPDSIPTWTTNSGKSNSTKKRKVFDEDSYFEDEEDPPVPKSSSYDPFNPTGENESGRGGGRAAVDEDEDDIDPLDAFMAENAKAVEKEKKKVVERAVPKKGVRDDIEQMDEQEQFYQYVKNNPNAGRAYTHGDEDESEEDIDYDEYGNATKKKKEIDPLPVIYHSEIEYEPFEKSFYKPHDEIVSASKTQINKLLGELGIRIQGYQPQRPVSSFGHLSFPDRLLERIRKSNFIDPTPIQSAAIPQILSGRDVMGIAQTGSGKTGGFVWPMIIHCSKQPPLQSGDGPIGLVMAPTRELCQQLYQEVRKFAKNYSSLRVGIVFGGGNMYDQGKELKRGIEILIATPGRLIDHVKKGNTNLQRVTVITLDEADRMLELGFEPQVRSICNHIRPDRQCLFFSATFKKKIERLARDILNDPIKITQGNAGQVNEDVTQYGHIISQEQKINWLINNIVPLTAKGSMLVFVTRKADSVRVHEDCKKHGYKTGLIHGDMHQAERNDIIALFKQQKVSTLIATDVAARGLDISHIKTVVNYDPARNADTHVHRIGRTARAGNKGDAISLLTPQDAEYAAVIVKSIETTKQSVPPEILRLAMKDLSFKATRGKDGTKTGYSDSDRVGFGGSTNAFEPIMVEYSAPSSFARNPYAAPSTPATQEKKALPLGAGAAGYGESAESGIASARSSVLSSRAQAIKNAYKSQFGRQFVASTQDSTPATQFSDPTIGQAQKLTTPSHLTPSSSSSVKTKRKKSRWE